MEPYLANKPAGFYIEAGAFDGLGQSVTRLWQERGWHGMLIEPHPVMYQRLVGNRPNDICLPYCLVGDDSITKAQFHCCDFMSLMAGARGSDADDQAWLTAGEYAQGIARWTTEVECRTLESLLDAHAITKIDWLVLDVEGNELQALHGLNLRRYRPEFILVELSRLQQETVALLCGHGYDHLTNLAGGDFLFQRADT